MTDLIILGIECEWDIGQEGVCFLGYDAVHNFISRNWDDEEMEMTQVEAEEQGLLSTFNFVVEK